MPRRLEDIIINDRRSIKDPPSVGKSRVERTTTQREYEETTSSSHFKNTERNEHKGEHTIEIKKLRMRPPILDQKTKRPDRRFSKKQLWSGGIVGAVILIAIAGYFASQSLARATFTITPVSIPVKVSNTLVASGTGASGYISYGIVESQLTASTTIAASDGAYVSTKTTATVTIGNAYSPHPQRLIAGTRLAAGNSGLIYRLTSSITIPGYTMSSQGVLIPGHTNVGVVADQPGEIYNFAKDNVGGFKIVAYKGTPRYDTFTVEAASNGTGGFVGHKKIIDPANLATSTAALEASMLPQLAAAAQSHVPADQIMFAKGYITDFTPTVSSSDSASSAVLSVSGTLYGITFKRAELVAKLAGQAAVDTFGSFAYSTPGLEQLDFTITNPKDFSPTKKSALIARWSGDMSLVGTIPTAELRHKLAGVPLNKTIDVLKAYSPVIDISHSTGELFPSWASTVPSDENRINIVIKGQ